MPRSSNLPPALPQIFTACPSKRRSTVRLERGFLDISGANEDHPSDVLGMAVLVSGAQRNSRPNPVKIQ